MIEWVEIFTYLVLIARWLTTSIPHGCTVWRWRRQMQATGMIQSRKRECRSEISLRPSVEA
jgi:hypothetical protein